MHIIDRLDVFSDIFAQKRNFVTGIEARTKIVFIIVALVMNLLSPSIYTPVSFAGFSLIALLLIRVPARLLLLRLATPMVMATVVLITQIFFYGETPLFAIPLWQFSLVGYEEGLTRGLLIMSRVVGGISLILLLSMSTPADRLFLAAAWFKIPKTFVELALLVYRYIFVLAEELITMKDAQRLRMGYHNWRQSMRSLSMLGACLILRTYDRAERVFEAMLVRGYASPQLNHCQVFTMKDGLVASCLGLALVGFYLIGQVVT